MITNTSLNALRYASSLLKMADNELLRPEEDSVMFCACQCSRSAAITYLKCFLAEHEANNASNSIETLMSECCRLQPDFGDISFSSFSCSADEGCEGYCLERDTVNDCLVQAKHIEAFVLKNLELAKEDIS